MSTFVNNKPIPFSKFNPSLITESPVKGLNWLKKTKVFKRANLTFDPFSGLGHSYGWYEITKVVNGNLILNSYPYSSTTANHVRLLRRLFDKLGIEYFEVYAPMGLQYETL